MTLPCVEVDEIGPAGSRNAVERHGVVQLADEATHVGAPGRERQTVSVPADGEPAVRRDGRASEHVFETNAFQVLANIRLFVPVAVQDDAALLQANARVPPTQAEREPAEVALHALRRRAVASDLLVRLDVPAGLEAGAEAPVRLLFLVLDFDLGEVERDLVDRSLSGHSTRVVRGNQQV